MKALLAILFFTALIPGIARGADAPAGVLEFDIPVSPGAARYTDLLAYPPFLAVALDNNGIRPSNSGRVVIVDRQTLQFRNARVKFLGRQGAVFQYEGKIEWDIGVTQARFTLPVEADLSALASGKVTVRVRLPMAKLFPQTLTDRIRLKVQSLAGPEVQKRMLDYLDAVAKKAPPGRGVDGLFEPILADAYNLSLGRSDAAGREPGDAEPLSDQLLFFATLAIWLVIVPLALLGRKLWRKYRRRSGAGATPA
ncbi:MAG: hypothetical protein WA373_14980 [Burkholderiales bacterium]